MFGWSLPFAEVFHDFNDVEGLEGVEGHITISQWQKKNNEAVKGLASRTFRYKEYLDL